MNTPAHAVTNLLLLARGERPRHLVPVAVGSVLPDLPMVLFYAWEKLVAGTPEAVIWGVAYYRESWQSFFDLFNSLPLLVLGWLLARWSLRRDWAALFASMALHAVCDLPLHNDDAHRHLWPFSGWRFHSPVSYWDPDHFGLWVSLAEIALMIVGSVVLFRRFRSPRARWGVALVAASYLLYVGYVLVVWV